MLSKTINIQRKVFLVELLAIIFALLFLTVGIVKRGTDHGLLNN